MTSAATVRRRARGNKFEERRRELADAALLALADLGYARASLRTIAEHTEFSHGLLHYYFADKIDLITYCVQRYKAACVQRYDSLVAEASTPGQLANACGDGLAEALGDAPLMHRLWYDLRIQSMFEDTFRKEVAEIDESLQQMLWRNVRAYADLSEGTPSCSPEDAYALFDGLFQQALLRYLAGTETAQDDLRHGIRTLLPRLVD
ncbi:TetR/AcrR family transcriptional regulator [Sciscionella sediminilitoris]|uniref:TetR/AcrR family transcriptional regulator n=1 Tax=Sciscionella sediminilitoris TaxID=1445613 RepID=UPI0004DFC8DD|nr:TetR/AcrR family transcriptional regulator [Sciscionella sp. SE31]